MIARCAYCARWVTQQETLSPCPRCGRTEWEVREQGQAIAHEKSAIAQQLASKHYEAESGLQRVIRLNGSEEEELQPGEPIKLLEVNADTIPSGVLPVQFGPSPASGVPYPSVIVEVSPDEFVRIQAKELPLPKGWQLGDELPRQTARGA